MLNFFKKIYHWLKSLLLSSWNRIQNFFSTQAVEKEKIKAKINNKSFEELFQLAISSFAFYLSDYSQLRNLLERLFEPAKAKDLEEAWIDYFLEYGINSDDEKGTSVISEGDTSIHLAVKHELEAFIPQLINAGADINKCNRFGETPLHCAVKFAYSAKEFKEYAIRILMDNGASPYIQDVSGVTPVQYLILEPYSVEDIVLWLTLLVDPKTEKKAEADLSLSNAEADLSLSNKEEESKFRPIKLINNVDPQPEKQAETIKAKEGCIKQKIEEKGIDINAPIEGKSLLHHVILKRDIRKIELLLNLGAEPDTQDKFGRTPLQYAMQLCTDLPAEKATREAIVSLLVDHNANIFNLIKDKSLFNKELQRKVARLIDCKGNVNLTDRYGYPLLHYAIQLACNEAKVIIARLLEKGGDINVLIQGQSLLHKAVQALDTDRVKLLLHYRANPNQPDTAGYSPLHYAIQLASAAAKGAIVNLLIGHGGDINALIQGQSLLHKAVQTLDIKWVERLLAYGANPNQPDTAGYPPLHYAIQLASAAAKGAIVNLLIGHGGDINALIQGQSLLHKAVQTLDTDQVERLLDYGANPNQLDTEGYPPLHYAIQLPDHKAKVIIARLLNKDGDINVLIQGQSLLHKAVQALDTDQVERLLDYGANPNQLDTEGYPPLHYAIQLPDHKAKGVIARLLEKGGDINACIQGQSLLHKAVQALDTDQVERLLVLGAEPDIQDHSELQYAVQLRTDCPDEKAKRETIVSLLIDHNANVVKTIIKLVSDVVTKNKENNFLSKQSTHSLLAVEAIANEPKYKGSLCYLVFWLNKTIAQLKPNHSLSEEESQKDHPQGNIIMQIKEKTEEQTKKEIKEEIKKVITCLIQECGVDFNKPPNLSGLTPTPQEEEARSPFVYYATPETRDFLKECGQKDDMPTLSGSLSMFVPFQINGQSPQKEKPSLESSL